MQATTYSSTGSETNSLQMFGLQLLEIANAEEQGRLALTVGWRLIGKASQDL
jgi:hypothetical protein